MAMREILDRQANSVEYVLHTHGIRAHIDGGRLSPRLAHFHIVLPPGVRATQLAPLVSEIAEALGVTACRLSAGSDGELYLEVPRPDPMPVRLLPLVQRVADVVPPVTATLGVDTQQEGTPLLLRLNAADVDPVLVSGNRGAGKSKLLRSMALSLALHNSPDKVRLLLLDCTGDGVAFRGLESLPHLACPVATGPVDGLVSLRWAVRTLTRRDVSPYNYDVAGPNSADSGELFFEDDDEPQFGFNGPQAEEPALVVMIDGADSLLGTANRRANAEALDALNRLAASGNRHGIHLVIAAERPDIDLGVDWGARVTGVTLSPEMARLSTGMKGSGAQSLLGAGDFLISLNAELIRFQAAATSSAEVGKAVDLINSWLKAPREEQVNTPPRMSAAVGSAPGARSLSGPGAGPRAEAGITQMRRERTPEEPLPLRRSWAGE